MIVDNVPLNANSLLQQYGGINKHKLKNLLDSYKLDTNEPEIIRNSPYYSCDNLPNLFQTKHGNFTILSLNVDGILSKINELRILIQILHDQEIHIDVICIQESHLNDSYTSNTACLQIDGFDCIPQEKK